MLRARWFHAPRAVLVGLVVFVGSARAQDAIPAGSLYEMPLPGGIRAALAAADDGVPADRARFLLEIIRRSYDSPAGKTDPRDAARRSLLTYLAGVSTPDTVAGRDTLPLPLPPATWTRIVFGGRATPDTLALSILGSRGASLLYAGLLALDDETRAWIASQPALIVRIVEAHGPAFLAAAPGLRISGTVVRVPGGAAAEQLWETVAGRSVRDPAAFVRAVLETDEGRLAYFLGAVSQLSPAQLRFTLALDKTADARLTSVRRLQTIFARLSSSWKIDTRPFYRPPRDPALLVAELRQDATGRPAVPGTRGFWLAVFDGAAPTDAPGDASRVAADREPVEFSWLCEQIFSAPADEVRRRYQQVLFASRLLVGADPAHARDATDAVRAVATYPALVASLERARLADVGAFARAAGRAARLSALDDDDRAVRALAQFQGTLAILGRASLRGSLPEGDLPRLVASLAAIEPGAQGDYEGRLVRWLDAFVREARASADDGSPSDSDTVGRSMADEVLQLLSGPVSAEPQRVHWEGTQYRLDFSGAEANRLTQLLGERAPPYLSSARSLVSLADGLTDSALTIEGVRRVAVTLAHIARRVEWADGPDPSHAAWPPDVTGRYRDAAESLTRAVRAGDVRAARLLAPSVTLLADDLLARGLVEIVYATALGRLDLGALSAAQLSRRHDFGRRLVGAGRDGPWRFPVSSADPERGWRVTGSLFDLDVRLASFSLTRVSDRALLKRPTLNDEDRRVAIETVVLVDARSLTEAGAATIVTAIGRGRARIAALRVAADAAAVADDVPLGPVQRSLLPWIAAHDPTRLPFFLSPSELLGLGLGQAPLDPVLHAWGSPGQPRNGCLCLQLLARRPWETLGGRWNSGILFAAFPDLNLRLAELLSDLRVPASLLAPVLAAATFDFVNTAVSRDHDDRRGLVEFVQGLRVDDVEQYLALLTTDGPLVPVGGASPASPGERTWTPR